MGAGTLPPTYSGVERAITQRSSTVFFFHTSPLALNFTKSFIERLLIMVSPILGLLCVACLIMKYHSESFFLSFSFLLNVVPRHHRGRCL